MRGRVCQKGASLVCLCFKRCKQYGPCLIRVHSVSSYDNIKSEVNLEYMQLRGAQWLSGRVLDSRSRGCGFEPLWGHWVVSLSKTLWGLKESKQKSKQKYTADVKADKIFRTKILAGFGLIKGLDDLFKSSHSNHRIQIISFEEICIFSHVLFTR